MNSDGFRVGDFFIEWRDDETVQITDTRLGRTAILHGGDFEGLLSGLVESVHLIRGNRWRADCPKCVASKFTCDEHYRECPNSPDGRHQVDTSMESGPNNCFHCEAPMPDTYRGWNIARGRWPEPAWVAFSPNYDASYEGPEDGWVDNGEKANAPTREALIEEIDAWFEEQGA